MSATLPTMTAEQPSFHTDNILAHPGSTAAGVTLLTILAGYLTDHPWPTTTLGWMAWGAGLIGAVGAVLGK